MPCPNCAPNGESWLTCSDCYFSGAWKPETPEQKIARLESRLRHQEDDRTRRIKERVLMWTSQKVHYAPEVKKLIELAAELIDAIDDAEVTAKESK